MPFPLGVGCPSRAPPTYTMVIAPHDSLKSQAPDQPRLPRFAQPPELDLARRPETPRLACARVPARCAFGGNSGPEGPMSWVRDVGNIESRNRPLCSDRVGTLCGIKKSAYVMLFLCYEVGLSRRYGILNRAADDGDAILGFHRLEPSYGTVRRRYPNQRAGPTETSHTTDIHRVGRETPLGKRTDSWLGPGVSCQASETCLVSRNYLSQLGLIPRVSIIPAV